MYGLALPLPSLLGICLPVANVLPMLSRVMSLVEHALLLVGKLVVWGN